MEQKQCTEVRITLTSRRYYTCSGRRGVESRHTADVELIIDVEGAQVYSVRGNPRVLLNENSMPIQFEQWAFEAYHLSEEFKRRQNSRSDGGDTTGGFKLFLRKVLRKFVDFKP